MDGSTVQVTRRCRKCGEEKPATREWFYRNDATHDGCQSWCIACFKRRKTYKRKTPRLTPEIFAARFWSKVNKDGPVPPHVPELGQCWEWTAYRNPYGYGEIGRSHPRRVEVTHRVGWELAHGPAGDLCVLHKCDNPACVRASHLFLGTRTENMADKVRKGRQTRGAAHGPAILSEDTVRAIRALRAGGLGATEIGRRLGVRRTSVSGIIHGYNWRHVP